MKPRVTRARSIAVLLTLMALYVAAPQNVQPTSASVLRSHTGATVNACGSVSLFTAAGALTTGVLTVGSSSFVLAPGATFNATPKVGVDQCFVLTLNATGQVTSAVESPDTTSTQTVCGQVTSYVAPTGTSAGSMTVGSTTFAIAAGATFTGSQVSTGSNLCLDLTVTGLQQVSAAVVSVYAPTTKAVCGQVSGYTASAAGTNGSITIGGTTYSITAGTAFAGSIPTNGVTLCFLLTVNGAGLITGGTASTTQFVTQTICGVVSGYVPATASAAGSITVGSTLFIITAGTGFTGSTTVTNGANVCFQLTQNATGQIVAGVVSGPATTQILCGIVSSYVAPTSNTNGSVTIGSSPFVIAAGTSITGAIANGQSLCFTLTTNTSGQITAAAVTTNASSTQIICGQVASYTAATGNLNGAITIGATAYPIAAGANLSGSTIASGTNLCFQFTLNGLGQVTAAAVTPNVISTPTVCGLVSNYTAATTGAAGTITIGTVTYTIVAGTNLSGTVSNGVMLCFALALNGANQITSASASAATTPTPTPTNTPTSTPTPTGTAVPATATPTSTPTATSTPPAPTPTNTPVSGAPTPTPRPTKVVLPVVSAATPLPTAIPIPKGIPHTGLGGTQARSASNVRSRSLHAAATGATALGITQEPRAGGADPFSDVPLLPLFGVMLTGIGILIRRLAIDNQ